MRRRTLYILSDAGDSAKVMLGHGLYQGYELQWQVDDDFGWKHMGRPANAKLVNALETDEINVEIVHNWQSPKSGKLIKSKYDVDLAEFTQQSRGFAAKERRVRLVAMEQLSDSGAHGSGYSGSP